MAATLPRSRHIVVVWKVPLPQLAFDASQVTRQQSRKGRQVSLRKASGNRFVALLHLPTCMWHNAKGPIRKRDICASTVFGIDCADNEAIPFHPLQQLRHCGLLRPDARGKLSLCGCPFRIQDRQNGYGRPCDTELLQPSIEPALSQPRYAVHKITYVRKHHLHKVSIFDPIYLDSILYT